MYTGTYYTTTSALAPTSVVRWKSPLSVNKLINASALFFRMSREEPIFLDLNMASALDIHEYIFSWIYKTFISVQQNVLWFSFNF